MTNPAAPPRVFISYAQQDQAHAARVLALANALRRDGVLAELDQYHQQELIHWPRWCQEQLRPERSDWVLMVCTPAYRERLECPEAPGPSVGRGVYWEGTAVINAIYADKGNTRFVPVLLDEAPEEAIPTAVEGYTRFRVQGLGLDTHDPGYEGLYRLITRQPAAVPGAQGPLVVLPPRPIPDPGADPVARPPIPRLFAGLLTLLVLAAGLYWWATRAPSELTEHLRRADAAMDTGRLEDALAEYRAAVKVDGDNQQARFGEAKARVLADPPPDLDQEKAGRDLTALRQAHPRDPHLPLLLGRLAQIRGDDAAARRLYEEALTLKPDLPQAWFGLGVLANSLGDPKTAQADYERADRLAPGQRQYLTNLAGVRLAQGDLAGALKAYQDLLAVAPGLLLARLDAGNAARLGANLKAACWHHGELLAALDREGAFAGPDNGGEWVFDTAGGEISLQTSESKRDYARATAALTGWLARPCPAAAIDPAGLALGDLAQQVLAEDLRRLGQVRPQWQEALTAFGRRLPR